MLLFSMLCSRKCPDAAEKRCCCRSELLMLKIVSEIFLLLKLICWKRNITVKSNNMRKTLSCVTVPTCQCLCSGLFHDREAESKEHLWQILYKMKEVYFKILHRIHPEKPTKIETIDYKCDFCGREEESVSHLFFQHKNVLDWRR